ncbi:MAG: N-succinylarginine dihydrolase [Deltaproteobacteria bacterium]|nr:N-succinylarginine dihydrolase [Deltaproteobacteria bacterium]
MSAREYNFDGLVGPSHHYGGLSFGNVASTSHQKAISHPKEAALQGLQKMKTLFDMGIAQGVLPPHERPFVPALKQLGYTGSDTQIIQKVAKENPTLLSLVSSASAMWTANAGTTSAAADTKDNKTHITAANLSSKFHRAIEANFTSRVLRKIFQGPSFVHHDPLPYAVHLSDEGAANFTRLCESYDQQGLEILVYGRSAFDHNKTAPKKFPARQTEESCQALARTHQLQENSTLLLQQSPKAIDAGVFHNDVISVGNQNVFLYHEEAFLNTDAAIELITKRYHALSGTEPIFIKVSSNEVSLNDAVQTYLFNSQIVTLSDKSMALIAPKHCEENPAVKARIDQMLSAQNNPINKVHYFDLKQSMQNGGGPACLRWRIVLDDAALKDTHAGCVFSEKLYNELCAWVNKHYRDELTADDLADPQFLKETRNALDELTGIMGLGSLYGFQD